MMKIIDFEADDHVRISKYKNIFAKGYTSSCSEEDFVSKSVKNTVTWTYVTEYLNGEYIIGFMKTNCNRLLK